MAEYIDRNGLIKFLDNLQQPKMPITKGFEFISIDDAIRVVSERPTADVVEREKIDKAIEEMNSIGLGVVMDCDEMRDYCIEILKRNIGE